MFNGFATYPVTIPGLTELGIGGVQAAVGYLIVGFDLRKSTNLKLAAISVLGNWVALALFTQVWPALYILTLIAGATFTLGLLRLFRPYLMEVPRAPSESRTVLNAVAPDFRPTPATTPQPVVQSVPIGTAQTIAALVPLLVGALLVIIWGTPAVSRIMARFAIKVAWFGNTPVSINFLATPGFYIFLAALCSYAVALKKSNPLQDLAKASQANAPALLTLMFGSAMVYLMVDSGQLVLLANALTHWGAAVDGGLLTVLTFLAGMAFGQGMPADFLFSKMQLSAAPLVHAPLTVLVAVAALMTMGPANPLKPSLLKYTSALAKVRGKDGDMFRLALPWQLTQMVVIAIATILLIALGV